MALPPEALKRRTYNVAAMSFTPEEIVRSVQRHVPDLKVTYAPDSRQQIADSWPQVFDDSEARAEWNWKPQYDIDGMVDIMVDALRPKYQI
ncbi:L-threonine 3-dehydrogenase, mitochondrial-like [Daphnia magna]|uniref:L-threonine 3-dehydrogenase, mitochondrial-like n=1 Tax=Daphnia magna TaxID=35525 RepID=UPI001E1BD2DC|nr:L-threonine 3-dehydrogenase, mitochondrial-like [Daphnia magna]